MNANSTSGGTISARRAWLMVATLSVLYFISFVDRAVLALVVAPLKADLGVSDVELGLLFGPAFAVFFALLGLPFARMADRGDRRRLVVAGALLWGACTLGSSLVNTYWLLVALRVGLAIGEATLTPAAYSLIGAMFPPETRVRAASIYSAIGVAGVSGAYIAGAFIIRGADALGVGGPSSPLPGISVWQFVFIAAGAPAIIGAFFFWAVAKEPARVAASEAEAGLGAVWRHVRATGGMYPLLFSGAGLMQAISFSYAAWGPEFMRRTYGVGVESGGLAFGGAGLIGAVLGAYMAPNIARVMQARGRLDAIALVASGVAVIGLAGGALAPLAPNAAIFAVLYCVASFGVFGASTGLVVSMQVIAPQEMRATLVAALLLCMTLLAGLLGPPLAAVLSTALSPTGERLNEALSVVSACVGVCGVVFLTLARAPLARHLSAQADVAAARAPA